jgi:hypothetical protein
LLEKQLFPHGDGTLIGFKEVDAQLNTYKLDIAKINGYDIEDRNLEAQAAKKEITTIVVDSASFLIFDLANFDALVHAINYDDLVSLLEDESFDYIETVNAKIGNMGWAYVVSPGIESGFEFEGDGSYLIS